MTSSSENEQNNEINIDTKQCVLENQQLLTTVIQETSDNDQIQEKFEQQGQNNYLINEIEDNKIDNNVALINTSPSIVTTDEEQQQQNEAIELTVNNDEDRSRKSFNSKVKYSSMPYHRLPYFIHDHPYGSAPYYYYPSPQSLPSVSIEKPTPLMFISTQKSPSSRDNQTNTSTSVSPQNLPPRLRQTSTTENDSSSQISSTTSTTSQSAVAPSTATTTTTTNGRRHRSILPRSSNNYYSQHPPPPLMATPPGVLYTYPPAVHPSGHIAYNIRPPDEFELLAFQQPMMNLSPGPILWPSPTTGLSPHGHPIFPPYPINGSLAPPATAYTFNNSTLMQSTNSFLNPDAAEWVPPLLSENDSSSENQILIDDEINFPPLNSTINNIQTITNTKDSIEDNSEQINNSSETISTNNNNNLNDNSSIISTDNSNISSPINTKTESTIISLSSQDNTNKSIKITPVTYSTITSQISGKNKINTHNHPQHIHNQLPPRDRTNKQRSQIDSHRRQPFNNNNRNTTRNLLTSETNSLSKQQQQQSSEINDDWIEVKSKKTKKFDRIINDNSSEKLNFDEQIPKSLSPPLSLTSTGDNTTTTTFTSEDDFDEKDNNDLVIIMNNNNNISNDYNHTIINDIHRRLNNNERLLIIMRGCPGSGKSTLAKSIHNGYNGVILSADDYFTDNKLNIYTFDPNKLDEAHRFTRRRASDALKRNLSPIIIDNTNTQIWEMKPYVAMGKEAGYDILLVEPQTPWRYKARELLKRNLHNLPLRRIKEMLNRFEHNITVQNILDQIILNTKSNNFPSTEQQNSTKTQEILDPILIPKKIYDIIDDSLILDDVRLCINDMILFLTSIFFQTTRTSQSSTSLSVSFHDLSLISSSTSSSLPSTPSTPHSRFHRPLTRFSSATNQDHSYNTEQIVRLPTTTTSRSIEINNLTPVLSASSNNIGKKSRKNKNKLSLNINNNNNNNNHVEDILLQQTFNVYLPEDCSDFIVIDEENLTNSIDRDHSSTISYRQEQLINSQTCELLNIIHTELNKSSHNSSLSTKHIAIQCSSTDFTSSINSSDIILIGNLSSSTSSSSIKSSIPIRPGYKEYGIQVDLNDYNIDLLINIYSNNLSLNIIKEFYEVCHSDFQWTCLQIDEYIKNNSNTQFSIPTLQQLSLEKLNQWNEEIKLINPLFDTNSIDDLLQDINNDNEIFDELSINSNQINISWSIMNSLEDNYGELPNKSILLSNTNGIILPLDDDLSMNIYQALQRFLINSNQKPVIENSTNKKKKQKKTTINDDDNNNQKWKLPVDNQLNTNNIPSLRQIMNEEQQAEKCQKLKKKPQLDYATEHKLKELEHHFPSFDRDLLYDIFYENGYDYDVTYICISTIFDEDVSITPVHRTSPSVSTVRSNSTVKSVVEPYENLRHVALRHAQQRKEFYIKAQQANHHGMFGVASFYIHRASEETRLIKDANRAAYERLSQWRLKEFYQTQRLDLHGLHSDEALNLFKEIEQELNEGNRKTTPKSIEIITGYGKNSIYGGGHGRIRSIILTYLQQRNYKYSEPNKGVILLQFTNARN